MTLRVNSCTKQATVGLVKARLQGTTKGKAAGHGQRQGCKARPKARLQGTASRGFVYNPPTSMEAFWRFGCRGVVLRVASLAVAAADEILGRLTPPAVRRSLVLSGWAGADA